MVFKTQLFRVPTP